MTKQNLHTHSSFSDGQASPEELVLAAMQKGFASIGFSEHAYTPYDGACCIKRHEIVSYYEEINRLKNKYADSISVFLGMECDSYYQTPKNGLDYTIGSSHYFYDEKCNEYLTFDYRHESLQKALTNIAGGDISVLVGIYYDNLVTMAQQFRPDIIGHMDLIKKLNGGNRYFDPESEWYRSTIRHTVKALAGTGCIIEVNTGGIYRGYLHEPYPSAEILAQLFEFGIPVTVSSDAHSIDSLDFGFDEAIDLIKKTGYNSIKQLTVNGFIDVPI